MNRFRIQETNCTETTEKVLGRIPSSCVGAPDCRHPLVRHDRQGVKRSMIWRSYDDATGEGVRVIRLKVSSYFLDYILVQQPDH